MSDAVVKVEKSVEGTIVEVELELKEFYTIWGLTKAHVISKAKVNGRYIPITGSEQEVEVGKIIVTINL